MLNRERNEATDRSNLHKMGRGPWEFVWPFWPVNSFDAKSAQPAPREERKLFPHEKVGPPGLATRMQQLQV